jgi:hypothetical protein
MRQVSYPGVLSDTRRDLLAALNSKAQLEEKLSSARKTIAELEVLLI